MARQATRKPGKYDHLLPKLPKLPPADLEYQQRVEDVKKRIRLCTHCEGHATEPAIDEPTDTKWFPTDAAVCHVCEGTGRRKLTGQRIGELYVIARADLETVVQALSDANLELEAVSQLLIASQESKDSDWGAFGASDRGLKLTNADALRLQPEIYPVASDKPAFREWCYAHALRNKMELPAKPMTDLVKLILLNGEKEPAGLKIYVRTKVVYTPFKATSAQPDGDDVSEPAEVF